MVEKYDLILSAEKSFAGEVALGVIVGTPQSAWHYLIPFMFVFDFLRRRTAIRRYTLHFMFPRELALNAAQDILGGKDRADRLYQIETEIQAWLYDLDLLSPAILKSQKEGLHLLVEHYSKLLAAEGSTYDALIGNGYGNRKNFQAHLRRFAILEEELDRAIIEKLGESERLREKLLAERQQVKRLSEKKVDQIFRTV
jgi:hypothetical protein